MNEPRRGAAAGLWGKPNARGPTTLAIDDMCILSSIGWGMDEFLYVAIIHVLSEELVTLSLPSSIMACG